jgi:ABC-2 type transport system ATP-binding protein
VAREFFGLLGPSGAGKATLLHHDARASTAGRVVSTARRRPPAAEAKRRIAVVPQTRSLDRDLTVREVLTFHGAYFGLPRAERESRADRLLGEMQLAEKARVKPLSLSGGLQQRLLIARALMHDPKVLLLDEPTIGLDPQARRMLWETLRRLHEGGLTLIMTTHYMEEADRLCQRLAIIDHGKILRLGTPAALKKALPGGRILDLWVRSAQPVAPRLESVAGVLRVEKVTSQSDEDGLERLRLFVDAQDGLLDQVLQAVQGTGADLQHVSLTPPSLEDVYIHLTGKELRE